MNATTRCAVVMALVVLAGACTGSNVPTAPTSPALPPPTVTAPPAPPPGTGGVPPSFPAVSRPARVYVAVNRPTYPIHGSPLASRYVLYDDGTFALQYASANYPFFEYRGTYQEANGLITFVWEGWSVAGPWGATASITADTLVVRYNEIMLQSDFENGVYVLVQ